MAGPVRWLIRPETDADQAAVTEVVVRAFGEPRFADFLTALRSDPGITEGYGLVAELSGEIVGFVAITDAELVGGDGPGRIANLSPLAVHPGHRRRGIGAALVGAVVAEADRRGEPAVVLEGDPSYYGRLGFRPAAVEGITIDLPEWAPPEAAQVFCLSSYRTDVTGHVRYPRAFGLIA